MRSYYEALNTGDAGRVAEHFTDDATHYSGGFAPYISPSARTPPSYWPALGRIEVANPKTGERRLDRGTEWFEFRDGRIAEVRAYHHDGPKNPSGDLLGFDHAGRGHTTL